MQIGDLSPCRAPTRLSRDYFDLIYSSNLCRLVDINDFFLRHSSLSFAKNVLCKSHVSFKKKTTK